jgi:hypothetical protein
MFVCFIAAVSVGVIYRDSSSYFLDCMTPGKYIHNGTRTYFDGVANSLEVMNGFGRRAFTAFYAC